MRFCCEEMAYMVSRGLVVLDGDFISTNVRVEAFIPGNGQNPKVRLRFCPHCGKKMEIEIEKEAEE